jgi:hypothetical protein
MRITRIGSDYISIDEDNINDEKLLEIPRVHIIYLCFFNPTKEKIEKAISLFPKTNRYVVSDNIRIYNYTFKYTSKKYYVMNGSGDGIITFFRKNNKVLMNLLNLSVFERQFVLEIIFEDILKNIEVVMMDRETFDEKKSLLDTWNGNVIIT